MKFKRALVAALLAISLSSASCLGPDHAYNQVKNWNAGLSEQDWVNEVVFLGLMIIPVYLIALFVDVVAFNTIQYWSGDNPINDPGAFKGFSSKD